ncbi:MAG TPA: putative urea ABC transporter substrate-binding protein [Burkholderiales bacterium]|nr:putative urea ABC transporter substrate-binding protein [Burkholderiales bacterium]
MLKLVLAALAALTFAVPAVAQQKFRVAWSHYTGWEPWGYAQSNGIIKKWAQKNGIDVDVVLINDYVESINLYTSGKFDACAMTNMDALTIPAVGGIDTTALIVGSFSNGNDGIVIKGGNGIKDLKGRSVKLVEFSVSHYLLARALTMNGMTERDVRTVNTSDADIAAVFASDPKGAAVTWNPPLQQARNAKGAKMIFDSSQIPGEIIDLMVVKTAAPESLRKTLAGAWYETLRIMNGRDKPAADALEAMAKGAGGTLAEFKAQLATTALFYNPAEAAKFATGADLKKTMEQVRTFTFSKGLFGKGAKTKDFVGIEFPDKSVLGDAKNVKLRFDASVMQLAADGKL